MKDIQTAHQRREELEKKTGLDLSVLSRSLSDDESNVRIENLIGGIVVPVGVAGPVTVPGINNGKPVYIPLATTEGALVASVNRGCKAIGEGKGLTVTHERPGTNRSPVFLTETLDNADRLRKWIHENMSKLGEVAKSTSHHIRLLSVHERTVGPYTYVACSYETEDAMGMNMVTIATDAIAAYIAEKTGVEVLALAGNFDSDKKPSWQSALSGRGFSVRAEVELGTETIRTILKTDSQRLFNVWLAKCLAGSAVAGSIGFNAHFANIIAAMYIATGQDAAHVVEGSTGMTMMRMTDIGIRVSVFLPSVLVGTVGGGTKLITQTAARALTGATHAYELARVVGAAVLAGEISLLASLGEGSLARTHKKLGR